jgi:hypothetical protein
MLPHVPRVDSLIIVLLSMRLYRAIFIVPLAGFGPVTLAIQDIDPFIAARSPNK